MTFIRAAGLLIALGLAGGATAAAAAPINLVTNPGFENGTTGGYDGQTGKLIGAPNGWTFTPAASGSNAFVGLYANSGMYGFQFEANGSQNDELSQTIATTPGTTYDISFYVYSLAFGGSNDLTVKFGNDQVFSQSFVGYMPYTEFTVSGTATAASTDLQFFGQNSFAVNALDDVSVTAVQAVPEPATLAILGTGLFGFGLLRRRSRV